MNKELEQRIANNPLAVRLAASVITVTKIQEIDDPNDTNFTVVLVSGVTAYGKPEQYEAAMDKFLNYLETKL